MRTSPATCVATARWAARRSVADASCTADSSFAAAAAPACFLASSSPAATAAADNSALLSSSRDGLPDSGAVSEVGSRFLASDVKLLMPRVRSFSPRDWTAASAFSASGEGASTVSNPTPESPTSSADTATGGAGAGSPSSATTSDGWSPRSRRSPRNSSASKCGDSLAHALPTQPHYRSPHTTHQVVPSPDTAPA
jgi:hypothetical protein